MNRKLLTTTFGLAVLAFSWTNQSIEAWADTEIEIKVIKDIVEITTTDDAEKKKTDASPLSVMPTDHIEYPDDRPSWITKRATELRVDYPDEKTIIIVTALHESPEASADDMKIRRKAALREFASRLTDGESEGDFFFIDDEEIDELVNHKYTGTAIKGGEQVHERAIEVVVSKKKRREMDEAWNNAKVQGRLEQVLGLVVFGFVALLGSSAVVGTISRRVERKDKLSQPKA